MAAEIREKIEKIPLSKIFTYRDLGVDKKNFLSAANQLSRLTKQGALRRFKKGVFYRPKITRFGEVFADSYQILETYLKRGDRRIGYITGMSLYHKLALTTQFVFVITVASYKRQPKLEYHKNYLRIHPVKSYVEVTNENWKLLEFLDLLRYFRVSPLDLDPKSVIAYFLDRLEKMSGSEQKLLVELVLSYPPRIRALLGALLEQNKNYRYLPKLRAAISPFSKYKLYYEAAQQLPIVKKWNFR